MRHEMNIDALQAIGTVHCGEVPKEELRSGQKARIEVFNDFLPALDRMEEHSFFWILCWLDRADRGLLRTYSWFLREGIDAPYGVFSLRSPARPNPISLTLVRLLAREDNVLHVDGLDVYDNTPVLDIKPYTKHDIVFSPRTPYIRSQERYMQKSFHKKALRHHREECASLALAVRMALAAEHRLGDITDDAVTVRVRGTRCFADTVQGITNARLANPPRFSFEGGGNCLSVWSKGEIVLTAASKIGVKTLAHDDIMDMDEDRLLSVTFGREGK